MRDFRGFCDEIIRFSFKNSKIAQPALCVSDSPRTSPPSHQINFNTGTLWT